MNLSIPLLLKLTEIPIYWHPKLLIGENLSINQKSTMKKMSFNLIKAKRSTNK